METILGAARDKEAIPWASRPRSLACSFLGKSENPNHRKFVAGSHFGISGAPFLPTERGKRERPFLQVYFL